MSAPDPLTPPTGRDVNRAAKLLHGFARVTPVRPSAWLSAAASRSVLLKSEHLQHTGTFKLRGAFVRVASLPADLRRRGVVAASAGNHAQGVAWAARHFRVPATVLVPETANPVKVAATEALGARVLRAPGGVDGALRAAAALAAEEGRALVHPFDDPHVVAGQGTIGLELLDQVPDLGTVLVPVGGGGLVSGVALAVKTYRPRVRVVGVQPVAAAAFARSWLAGTPQTAAPATIADGLAVARPGALPLALAARWVDDVVTVSEDALWAALRGCLTHEDVLLEPAGVAAVAALLEGATSSTPGPVVAVLSGGNTAPAIRAKLLHDQPDTALAGASG
jgi:threonine dehydratase